MTPAELNELCMSVVDSPNVVREYIGLLEKKNDELRYALQKCGMFKLQPNSIQQIVSKALEQA